MPQYQPRIAIVGGGPSGLTMGLLLQKNNIPCTIFELRPRPTEEEFAKPVGSLDLHEESGLAALKEVDLMDDFQAHTGVCAEYQVVAHRDGNILYEDDGTAEYRPEISRNSLTKILLDRTTPGTIRWEHKLVATTRHVTPSGNTETELDFGSNGKHTFDLVIGADGAWSRVRNLLTDTKPTYAGFQVITVTIREVTTKYPDIAKYIGPGSFTALGHKHGIMSQRASQDSARIYVFITTPDEHFGSTTGISSSTAAEATPKLFDNDTLLGSFGPKLKNLVQTACEEETKDNPDTKIDLKPLYNLPIGHTWPHKAGATIIGDAAHVMCPFAGEGVNLAMWDALDLSRAIVTAYTSNPEDAASFQNTLEPLVEASEASMAERAQEKAEETRENAQMMFGDEDGATNFVEFFRTALAQMGREDAEKPVKVFEE